MTSKQLINQLQKIIEANIDPSMFPYVKGNSIRIGHIVIRKNRKGYMVFDSKNKEHIDTTFSKTAAVALAKLAVKENYNYRTVEHIMQLDHIIEKNYQDSIFYAYTMEHSKDYVKKEVSETRFYIAQDRTQTAKDSLDSLIFSNL